MLCFIKPLQLYNNGKCPIFQLKISKILTTNAYSRIIFFNNLLNAVYKIAMIFNNNLQIT